MHSLINLFLKYKEKWTNILKHMESQDTEMQKQP